MPKGMISVIVPVYNLEDYIERTVKSICKQTYSDLEIILVDDGSTDKSCDILEKLKKLDSRIYVLHRPNGGVTAARLAGVESAHGDWIGFVDGDDYIEPKMYEHLLQNAINYNADIAHCGYQMVFPDRVDFYYNSGRIVIQDKHKGMKDLLEGKYVEPGLCNKLFARNLLNNLLASKKMDLSIKNNEDLLMNFYLFCQAERSVYEDFCPYHYMVRKNSASTAIVNENKLMDPLKVQETIYREVETDSELKNIVNRRMLACLIRVATISLPKENSKLKLYKTRARKELRKMVGKVMKGEFSKKQKLVFLWCFLCPASYELIHEAYMNISSSGKRFKV